MSRRDGWRALPWLAAAVLASSQPLWAQGDVSVAEQAARVARLDHAAIVAKAQADSADSAARARAPLDTIRAGALVIYTEPASGSAVRAGAAEAWPRLRSLLGGDSTLLKGARLFIRIGQATRPTPPFAPGTVNVMSMSRPTTSDVANGIVAWAAGIVAEASGPALRVWTGRHVPLVEDTLATRGVAYIDLVTAPSQAVRSCFTGDIRWCIVALGLDTTIADPITEWYDATERRMAAERFFRGAFDRRGAIQEVLNRCVNDEDDASCLTFLHEVPFRMVPPPLSDQTHRTVLATAVSMGGPGAYSRIAATKSQSIGRQIAAGAQAPLDSVIRVWRRDVLAARPGPTDVGDAARWTTLGWAVVLGILALRSTRWRSA